MKVSVVLSLLILGSTGYAANAAQPSDYTDIEVVAAKPRSPDVKPFVMAIFTKAQQQRMAAAAFKANAFTAKDSGQSR